MSHQEDQCQKDHEKQFIVNAQRKLVCFTSCFVEKMFGYCLHRTKRGANTLAKKTEKAGVPVAVIRGNKSQAARQKALLLA